MYLARSTTFKKQYLKMPVKIRKQFGEKLKLFLEDKNHPLLHTHQLTGKYKGLQSFNVNADVRVVFQIRDKDTLYLAAIGSHSELYK